MPTVKLCGYLTNIDQFNQFRIKFCDPQDDKQNTKYKLLQLRKTGGDNPIRDDHFIIKSKKMANAFQDDEPIEPKKLIGSLVEVTAEFRRYSFGEKFGWSLYLKSIKAISEECK